jgi:hypothetical protein
MQMTNCARPRNRGGFCVWGLQLTGRPSIFSQELADTICERLADGESLRRICEDETMPAKSTVFRWLAADKSFQDQYTRAREVQADSWADDILDISDDGANDTYTDGDGNERTNQDVIARSRLRVDTRKWLMARMAPKKYGDKITQEVTGSDGGPVQVQKIERVIVGPKDSNG